MTSSQNAQVPSDENAPHLVRPWRITFTGADPSCTRAELFALLHADSRIELALLYSETKAGSGRYPPARWIAETAAEIERAYGFGRVALHICGRAVRKLLRGERLDPDLGSLWRFERIQLNGHFDVEDGGRLRQLLGEYAGWKIITQVDSNPSLHDLIRRPGHQVLFDASGGRGIERANWPRHFGDWICGYAGGLGPDNIATQLPLIAAAADGALDGYWIDMETKLRDDNDHFSIGLARLALDAVVTAERRL